MAKDLGNDFRALDKEAAPSSVLTAVRRIIWRLDVMATNCLEIGTRLSEEVACGK